MQLFLELYGFLSVTLRGFIVAAQSLTLGGLAFLALALPAGQACERPSRRLLVWSARGLCLGEILAALSLMVMLRGTLDLPIGQLLGADAVIVDLVVAGLAGGNRLFCARMRVHARLRAAMRCHARRPGGGDPRRQPSRSRGDALCRGVRPYARRRRLDRRNSIFYHSLGANAGGRAASGRRAFLRDVAWLGRAADRRRRLYGGRLCRRARGSLWNLLWRHALRQDRAAGRLAASGRPEFPRRAPPAIRSLDAARRERAASRKSRSALA